MVLLAIATGLVFCVTFFNLLSLENSLYNQNQDQIAPVASDEVVVPQVPQAPVLREF